MRDRTVADLAAALTKSTAGLPPLLAKRCAADAWDAAERIYRSAGELTVEDLEAGCVPIVAEYMGSLPRGLQSDRVRGVARLIVRRFVPTVDPGPSPKLTRKPWADGDIDATRTDGWGVTASRETFNSN